MGHLAHDQEMLDKLQTPCSVFLTCETEEGFNRAAKYNETVKMKDFEHYNTFLYHEIDVKEASEPTDIIWENRHYKPIQRFYKKIIVFGVIFLILYLAFKTIFGLQKQSLAMKGRYPAQRCDDYKEQYQGRRQQWMSDAVHEYQTKSERLKVTDQVFYNGPMQCFCKEESHNGESSSQGYTFTDKEG